MTMNASTLFMALSTPALGLPVELIARLPPNRNLTAASITKRRIPAQRLCGTHGPADVVPPELDNNIAWAFPPRQKLFRPPNWTIITCLNRKYI
ncbi:protein of unknown function [Candidatus Promineifilum breve]|uniref:Uncharacterized protein n=1 Tax=Candidatus Promineifilum breve TaxID=1806508 RepID=A0A160T4G1_9CHLR|nr:protein of unknown function [Candidatus Promineifilum breve]